MAQFISTIIIIIYIKLYPTNWTLNLRLVLISALKFCVQATNSIRSNKFVSDLLETIDRQRFLYESAPTWARKLLLLLLLDYYR